MAINQIKKIGKYDSKDIFGYGYELDLENNTRYTVNILFYLLERAKSKIIRKMDMELNKIIKIKNFQR